MKKMICLALLILFLLGCAAALGEEIREIQIGGVFRVKTTIPEGYTYTDEYISDILYVGFLTPADPSKVQGFVTIAYDEEAGGRTLNDYSEEELAKTIALYLQDMPGAEVSESQTGKGTRLLVFTTKTESENRMDIMTIWHGYQIAIMIIPGEGMEGIVEDQMSVMTDFLTNVEIEQL